MKNLRLPFPEFVLGLFVLPIFPLSRGIASAPNLSSWTRPFSINSSARQDKVYLVPNYFICVFHASAPAWP